ncbi:30S ribosomal protein S9 [Porphyridium purpureum]|uniref:30S ribosomal protein S9 n=1 Tax=Porphyridium purpureum TaxID=35688 RepID=A0A5J4Z8Z1_PORPP|nr:30S ribosomal protein S9 [Porphyridium purpureum]|eukprot:POR1199..scf295_1
MMICVRLRALQNARCAIGRAWLSSGAIGETGTSGGGEEVTRAPALTKRLRRHEAHANSILDLRFRAPDLEMLGTEAGPGASTVPTASASGPSGSRGTGGPQGDSVPEQTTVAHEAVEKEESESKASLMVSKILETLRAADVLSSEHPITVYERAHLEVLEREQRHSKMPKPPKIVERKVQMLDDGTEVSRGVGKRKTAISSVELRPGTGKIIMNGIDWVEFMPRLDLRMRMLEPLMVHGVVCLVDLKCYARGGGLMGRAMATQLAIARAMQNWNPEWRADLRKAGLLTVDSRIVLPKIAGKLKNRKRRPWVKR